MRTSSALFVVAIVLGAAHGLPDVSGTCPGAFDMTGFGQVSVIPTGWGNPTASDLEVLDLNGGLRPHMGSRGYFASTCSGTYDNRQYLALNLLGKELTYDVDLSGAGCGCNVAFYLVSMHQNEKESQCFDYYCDANDVCGESCAEIDIMEANVHSWHSTLHTQFDHDGFGGGYGGGDGWNGPRDWTKAQYSPGGSCIDTNLPFQVKVAFPVDETGMLAAMEVTLSQAAKACPLSVRLSEYAGMADLTRALTEGMTPVLSYWSSDKMLWMDGVGNDQQGPCRVDEPDKCSDSVQMSNFAVNPIAAPSNLPSRHDVGRKSAHKHKHVPATPQPLPTDSCPGTFGVPGYGDVQLIPTGWAEDSASNVEVQEGGVIVPHMGGRAYFADTCTPGIYNNEQYSAMNLLGNSMLYTMDLSGAGCGCNAAMYLVSMRQNTQPSTCSDYYCDANSVCGVSCAEIDIQEANEYAWHSTLHTEYDHEGLGAGFGGGDGWNGPRDFMSWQYGPGAQCVDTKQPFQVNVSFPVDARGTLQAMEVTLTQDGKTCSQPISMRISKYKGTGMSELSVALKDGMTPVISYWASAKMLWLDGNGVDHQGPCAVDNPEQCSESVKLSNFRVEPLAAQPEPEKEEGVCVDQWIMEPQCVMSFNYKGSQYTGCTAADAKSRRWCSHDAEYGGKWSYCSPCDVIVAGQGRKVIKEEPTAQPQVQAPVLAKPFSQCGGHGYNGPTECEPGHVCTFMNEWWSHCRPVVEDQTNCFDGWRPDQRCAPLFVYDDTEFTGCSTADSRTHHGWCARSARYDGVWYNCTACQEGDQMNLQKKYGAPHRHVGGARASPLATRIETLVVAAVALCALVASAIKVQHCYYRQRIFVRPLVPYEELGLMQQPTTE